jgi:hypothetical protein
LALLSIKRQVRWEHRCNTAAQDRTDAAISQKMALVVATKTNAAMYRQAEVRAIVYARQTDVTDTKAVLNPDNREVPVSYSLPAGSFELGA